MVDVVLESWKEEKSVEQPDGSYKTERIINDRRAWWQTHHIGTMNLGRFALERENLGNLFRTAHYHMTSYRAKALMEQGKLLCDSYDYSMDAKSSESLRDQHNSNLTLLAMLAKAKTEKQFTMKGEIEKSLWDGITGRKANESAG